MNLAPPEPSPFLPFPEISQAIDSVLALLENDLEKSRIEVRKGYSPNGLTVEADRDQMKQVFLNLFANAIEAMAPPPVLGPSGRPSEAASGGQTGGGVAANAEKPRLLDLVAYPDGRTLVVKIRDTGAGIAESQLPLIFAPFFTTKEKGSGLGLAIVQSILQVHGAAIRVESQVGVGTTFTITFPRRQADRPAQEAARPAQSSATVSPKPAEAPRPSALSVLVVEPLDDAREGARDFFESKGITCWTATDEPQAVECLKERWPNVVVSEVVLTSLAAAQGACEGFRVLQEAKRLAPSRPVFLLTAYDLPEFRQRAQQLGADGYLVKPIPTDALLSLLPAAYWK